MEAQNTDVEAAVGLSDRSAMQAPRLFSHIEALLSQASRGAAPPLLQKPALAGRAGSQTNQ